MVRVAMVFEIIILMTLVVRQDAYRFLGLYTFQGRSHSIMMKALGIALAKSGHQIDVVSHFPLEKPIENYRDVVNLDGSTLLISGNMSFDYAIRLSRDPLFFLANDYGNSLCELLGHEKMKDFMENLSNMGPYDAVIVETFGAPCYTAFSHYFKAPLIIVAASIHFAWTDYTTRNPPALAYLPHHLYESFHTFDKHNFWSRLYNTYSYYRAVYRFFKISEAQNEVIYKYLGPDTPDLRTLEKSAALLLVNSHYSVTGIRPFLPSIVEIAGLHISQDTTEMSEDLQKWMDECTDGVVLLSLGSLVNIETMSKDVHRAMFKSLGKLDPIKILMKVNRPELITEKVPSNIKMLRWVPQIPVLRHNNTKFFITHGGMMSYLEAVYHHVPMIGIPFFADQLRNAYIQNVKDFIIPIPHDRISEKTLDSAFNAILRDPKYKKAAVRASRLFRDRPLSASKTAIYWIEYVIRNGASSLRSPGMELYWWQNDLLDVYLFMLTIVVALLYTFAHLCQRLLKMFSRTKGSDDKKRQ